MIFPDAPVSEWRKKAIDEEREIRVIQLRDPNLEISNMWRNNEDIDDEEEPGFLESSELLDETLVRQTYTMIKQSKSEGLTQNMVGQKLGLNKLNSRTLIRNLLRLDLLSYTLTDEGRQRTKRYALYLLYS